MASTINGTSTGNGGLISTGDDSGILNIQTNETTAITVDASQRAAFVAGTAALPAITTDGDTNTGIFFPSADTIAFSEGGAEAMRIDSSGNVGIGTASPAVKLHVSTASASAAVLILNSTNNTPYMRFDESGGAKFIIGESSIVGGGGAGYYDFYVGASVGQRFFTGAAERMRIDSSGNLLVGGTTVYGSCKTTIDSGSGNSLAIRLTNTGSSYTLFFYNSTITGSIGTNGTTTSFNTSSDYRLKENIAPMTGALAKVAQLKPVTYKWKSNGSDGQGFIAHELAEVVPDCVTGEKDAVGEQQYEVTPAVKDEEGRVVTAAVMGTRIAPVYQGIDTSFLVATLTAAIQELKAINDTQAELISGQAATINALVTRIEALENRA